MEANFVLIDRYRLVERLGCNGFRKTWLAVDRRTDRKVLLKTLLFARGFEWQNLKLVEREAQVLEGLSHPYIPRYVDSFWEGGPEGDYFCLVAEYIPGRSLEQCIREGEHFSEVEMRRIARELLEILRYLHTQSPPVVHRDLKPGNVILGDDGHAYLVDFGAVQHQIDLGQTLTVVGTYGYMAPEQFGGRGVPTSDLYGLGATLLFALSGRHPGDFERRTLWLLYRGRTGASAQFEDWLSWTLAPEATARFPSAAAALKALERGVRRVPGYPATAGSAIGDRVWAVWDAVRGWYSSLEPALKTKIQEFASVAGIFSLYLIGIGLVLVLGYFASAERPAYRKREYREQLALVRTLESVQEVLTARDAARLEGISYEQWSARPAGEWPVAGLSRQGVCAATVQIELRRGPDEPGWSNLRPLAFSLGVCSAVGGVLPFGRNWKAGERLTPRTIGLPAQYGPAAAAARKKHCRIFTPKGAEQLPLWCRASDTVKSAR